MSETQAVVYISSLAEVSQRLAKLEANQEVTMEMIRLILQELGIRTSIQEVAERLSQDHGSLSPVAMDTEGE